jgi:Spy/CpxP family protein refolding chaperone
MKTFFTQNRILIWLIMILLIINISAIITVIYSIKATNEFRNDKRMYHRKEYSRYHSGRSFKDDIELSEKQHQHFIATKHKFFKEAGRISEQMHKKRVEFINEITSDNPDTIKIREIANEIGSLHAKLKYQTYKHYIEMKSVCDKEQEEKLMLMFKSMLNEDPFHPGSGRHDKRDKSPRHRR